MSDALVPIITRAGLAACVNAQGTGLLATIAAVAVGRGVQDTSGAYVGYAPGGGQTALKSEIGRAPLLQGVALGSLAGSDPLGFRVLAQIPALATGTAPIPVNEVGWFLEDGTMLCVWASPDYPLAYLTDKATLDLAHDLYLSQLPVSAMTITVLRPDIPDTSGVLAQLVALSARDATQFVEAITRKFQTLT